MKQIKIIVEKDPEGYVAYHLGLKGDHRNLKSCAAGTKDRMQPNAYMHANPIK